jgi:hypothetical protein
MSYKKDRPRRNHIKADNEILDLLSLQTEAINRQANDIDQISTLPICTIINEDRIVAASVTACLQDIICAIDSLLPRARCGGRVVYVSRNKYQVCQNRRSLFMYN